MEWYKVEDYPVGSDEYVLVSKIICDVRKDTCCFVAMFKNGRWQDGCEYSPTTEPDSRPIWRSGKEIGREPYNKLFVEINTLEELVNFMTELNQKIILRREDEEDMSFGHLCLEIYDGWRK